MDREHSIQILLGKLLSKTLKYTSSFIDIEFSVFSQFGDDGIIQFLINEVKPNEEFFIEFGVENYLESNTRFLLQNNNWSGLIMDGSKENIDFIKKQEFFWKHDLRVIEAFVTSENINKLLNDVPQNTGLLHIDVDGNDYWIWKAISVIEPDIIIMEYNSVFGYERAITVPYDATFIRQQKHYSYLYAGASLLALCDLAEEKGYHFVGSNSAGNNAYFIKREKIGNLRPLSAEEGYIESKFRESRNEEGELNFAAGANRLKIIEGMPIFNTRLNRVEKL